LHSLQDPTLHCSVVPHVLFEQRLFVPRRNPLSIRFEQLLPGNSGTGSYHGKHSFDTFSHHKPIWWKKQNMESMLAMRYPPFSEKNLSTVSWSYCWFLRRCYSLQRNIDAGWQHRTTMVVRMLEFGDPARAVNIAKSITGSRSEASIIPDSSHKHFCHGCSA